jgi:parallel beta-helix repeat protein
MARQVLDSRDFADSSSSTAGIQEAIDALPKGGGVVHVPAGRHALRRSIEMRSGVTLRGDGPATVLTRPKEVHVHLARPADGASKTVHLRHAAGDLSIGDEVYIGDQATGGWWAGHCIIEQIRGKTLVLHTLHGDRKHRFLPKRRAFIANWFPAIWLRDVRDATIEDLAIDGLVRRRHRQKCDFVVAAVHSRGSRDIRVLNVTVRNWLGDGIGIQGGQGSLVRGCIVENCVGHGFHPGTGLTQSVWSDNIARGNTRDGLFFCLRVTHSTVRGNVLVDNGGHGIGGLTDPDAYNAVIGNICAGNGKHGIDADRAIGNTIEGNVCRGNSRAAPGQYAGIYLAGHRHCVVTGNVCVDDAERPTQRRGLVNREPAGPNTVGENLSVPE